MAEKDKQILDAAMQLFARYGLKKATVDEIAKAAGVGKGTIYLYFKSKEEIFAAVLSRECAAAVRELKAAIRDDDTVAQKLRSFIHTRFRYISEKLNRLGVTREIHTEFHWMTAAHPPIRKVVNEYLKQERAIIGSILETGNKRGELDVDDIPAVAIGISSALEGLVHPWIYGDEDLSLERKTDVMVRLFMDGLRVRTPA